MANFDVASAVEALTIENFPADGQTLTIPEPTQEQVDQFLKAVRQIVLDYRGAVSAEGVPVTIPETEEASERIAKAVAAVCSDSPTAEQVRAMPHRVRVKFSGWLVGQLSNPT